MITKHLGAIGHKIIIMIVLEYYFCVGYHYRIAQRVKPHKDYMRI